MEWLIFFFFFFKKKPAGSTLVTSARPPRVAVSVVYVHAVGRDVLSCRRSDGEEMKRALEYVSAEPARACARSFICKPCSLLPAKRKKRIRAGLSSKGRRWQVRKQFLKSHFLFSFDHYPVAPPLFKGPLLCKIYFAHVFEQ